MNARPGQTAPTVAVAAAALACGAPVTADDTEVFFPSPDSAQSPKPNVLFILDTSGSMMTVESTRAPYDASLVYPGDCDHDAMYWTETELVPACTPGNDRWVDKSAFECNDARRRIDAIGSYTDTMVQFRDADGVIDADNSDDSWTFMEAGNHEAPVECRSDSGVHGDGRATEVYAAAMTGKAWTSQAAEEVAWGSAPRNVSYTFYAGNYLNWKDSPRTANLSRMDIMKAVTKTVLNAVSNLNVGIMGFNGSTGGTVLSALQDLDANRPMILSTIDTLPASGQSPLSETLYESARYWTGGPLDFGDPAQTDPKALSQGLTSATYRTPEFGACAKNVNVLITDGEPTGDEDAPARAATLPGWDTIVDGGCQGTDMGHCLDEISGYLAEVDAAIDVNGRQAVTTHAIGFTIDLPVLRDAAEVSGGRYFLADEFGSLTDALLSIVGEVDNAPFSFAPPAVAVNTFNRTRHLNELYVTVFSPRNRVHWPGNLKKYGVGDGVIIDADGKDAVNPASGFFRDKTRSLWTVDGDDGGDVRLGGAARRLPDPAARNLYTNNGSDVRLAAAANSISPDQAHSYVPADFGLTGAEGEPTPGEMIDWMRGVDVRDEDDNEATTVRYAMGDPLHSQPAAVVYGGTEANPDVVVYTATNDGYVHAIDGATGVELWAFVPREVLPKMARLFFDPSARFKQYGVDGSIVPVIKDVDGDGVIEAAEGDFVRIIMGMRRGGSTYYALDVTNRHSPELMWTKTLDGAGQSWSTPVITRMDIDVAGLNADKAVVVVGGGYDPVHDTAGHPALPDAAGAGIHFLDLVSGITLWRGGADRGATQVFDGTAAPHMNRAFPTRISVTDTNGDRFADRLYAVDIAGQVWRFDVLPGEVPTQLVNGGIIAQLGAEGLDSPTAVDTRRFYNAPDVSIFEDPVTGRRYVSLALGSGYRAQPFDTSASDRFYSLRDPDVFGVLEQGAYDAYNVITESDLVEVSGSVGNVVGASARGWKFTLPPGQKVLAESITFDDEIHFVSFAPSAAGAVDCGTRPGANFRYRVSVANGDPVVNDLDAVTPGLEDEARRTSLAQGGIAPAPLILFPTTNDTDCADETCKTPPVLCVGVECFSPGFRNVPVRTVWSQDGIE